jgi:hypothetical protein
MGRAGRTVRTPWGVARVVADARVVQRTGDRRFATHVELLEADGGRLVRFAYATDGRVRRGPVTLPERDLRRLLAAIDREPELAQLLGRLDRESASL